MVKIGIIGGSGLDDPKLLKEYKEIDTTTKYGKPSSPLTSGKINDVEVVIIARHGRGHKISPTHVNNKANIQALKEQGCTHILATTACGSLKEEIGRGDLIILDQFIDFTKHRFATFNDDFSDGIKHVSMASPFNEHLRNSLIETSKELGFKTHEKGTVITIEGPRFSTKAESLMFRQFADVINMSIAPECVLANELGIPYAAIAMSTDYDCWKSDEEPVTWKEILKIFEQNAENVKRLLINVIPRIKGIKKEVVKESYEHLKKKIRTIPHWPKQGVMFRDITTLLKDPQGFNDTLEAFYQRYKNEKIDVVAAIESRGFILGGALAHKLGTGFIPLRKPGKLPYETIGYDYVKEYGPDRIEIHKDAISPGQNVLLIDDLIATGDTALAAIKLIEKLGGKIHECAFIVELPELKGREKIKDYKFFKLIEFEGE